MCDDDDKVLTLQSSHIFDYHTALILVYRIGFDVNKSAVYCNVLFVAH